MPILVVSQLLSAQLRQPAISSWRGRPGRPAHPGPCQPENHHGDLHPPIRGRSAGKRPARPGGVCPGSEKFLKVAEKLPNRDARQNRKC